jgi:D-sedoheptulose 7-phosphate isomerase
VAAERIARACRERAVRFRRGGKLIVFGAGGAGTDASHIAVEFMHPVIVGKRALPSIALSNDAATVTGVTGRDGPAEAFAHQLRRFAEPADMALGVSPDGRCPSVLRGLEVAHELGLFTLALTGGDGGPIARSPAVGHALVAGSGDPAIVKEIHVTTYHVLWELVHVFHARIAAGETDARAGLGERDGRAGSGETDTRADLRETDGRAGRGETDGRACEEPAGCVTCSDEARPARVVRTLGRGLALVDLGGVREQVSVALVDVVAGDTVLVHAKEAIAVVGEAGADGDG